MMVEAAPRFSPAVRDTVTALMGAHPRERSTIGEALGKETLLTIYEASCEALHLTPEVLLARAAEFDRQEPDESVAAAERSFYGSLIANYRSMYNVYQGDPFLTATQAEERALGCLRQAYAERRYRLARTQGLSLGDYKRLLRSPAFSASVNLVSFVTYTGHEQLSPTLALPALAHAS